MNTHLLKVLMLSTVCIMLLNFTVSAQVAATIDTTGSIKPITGGKYRIYFRSDYLLTTPACASFYREIAFDKNRQEFDGPFKDYRVDGVVISESAYKNGRLEGTFVVRYMSGKLWQKGTYRNGQMVGTWEYFYPNGAPMYTFKVINDRVEIHKVWDQDGTVLVENGNGKASIYNYNSRDIFNENLIYWKGDVKDGLMQGKWIKYVEGNASKIEQVYKDGKFIKGFDQGRMYNTVNYLYLGQVQALLNAEALQIATCEENPNNDLPPLYPTGSTNLKRALYKETDKNMRGVVKSGDVKISFNVDTEGNLSQFEIGSNTGVESLLVEALQKLGPWLPATEVYKSVAKRVDYTFYYRTMWDRSKKVKSSDDLLRGQHYYERDPQTNEWIK